MGTGAGTGSLREIQVAIFMSRLQTCPKLREFRLAGASMKSLHKRLLNVSYTGLGMRPVRLIAL